MIHRYLKIYIFLTLLFSDFIMFAQDPGSDFEDENGDTDGSVEDMLLPINAKLIWLAIAGMAYIFYRFRNEAKSTDN
jgi:hypothetical protein